MCLGVVTHANGVCNRRSNAFVHTTCPTFVRSKLLVLYKFVHFIKDYFAWLIFEDLIEYLQAFLAIYRLYWVLFRLGQVFPDLIECLQTC